MTGRGRALLFSAGAVLVGLACRHGGPRDVGAEPASGSARDSIFVEVINDNYYDARVHIVYAGGMRHAIGTVRGNSGQDRVAIPWQPRALVIEVALIVGSGVYRSEPMDVTAWDVVEVRVPANLEASPFFRRVSRN